VFTTGGAPGGDCAHEGPIAEEYDILLYLVDICVVVMSCGNLAVAIIYIAIRLGL
jgi:phage shock protein PspC (stress-responsive transcriptional regulator)